jgi:hypothetical protein
MGRSVPPPPISREEFDKRIAAGAKTMAEIDPAFHAWLRKRQVANCVMMVAVVAAVIVLAGIALFVASLGLP